MIFVTIGKNPLSYLLRILTVFLISIVRNPIFLQSDIGEREINIDEINSRQDQILIELDLLDKKISDIIEIWTLTDQDDEDTPEIDQAA